MSRINNDSICQSAITICYKAQYPFVAMMIGKMAPRKHEFICITHGTQHP
jgi:hypothetical protein